MKILLTIVLRGYLLIILYLFCFLNNFENAWYKLIFYLIWHFMYLIYCEVNLPEYHQCLNNACGATFKFVFNAFSGV